MAILAFPSNEFGHQTSNADHETLEMLKHIRPGGGFVPAAKVFAKCKVNGRDAAPLFKWLKVQVDTQKTFHDFGTVSVP